MLRSERGGANLAAEGERVMTRKTGALVRAATGAAFLLLGACNPVANVSEGDSLVEKFHAAYSRGDRDALYAMTGRQFRATTSRAQFDDLIDVVSVRLGAVSDSERTGFNVNTNTDGTFTSITMTTHFAKGDGVESFVFTGSGDEMALEGWHVQSPRLMLTADDVADERAGDAAVAEDAPPPVVMVEAAPAMKKKKSAD